MRTRKGGGGRAALVALLGGAVMACAAPERGQAQSGRPVPAAAGGAVTAAPNTLTPAEAAAGWRLLFDGTTMQGWRGYKQDTIPAGWQAVDGALTRVARGGDIITADQFDRYELVLEWMLRPGGNSGIFYHAVELAGDGPIYTGAPEMQVLDDERHADGRSPLTSSGANYGLHPAPRGVVRPVGEWNSVRLVVRGAQVEHWLNGTKIVEYVLGSDDWKARVAASKFAQWPDYGQARRGHIGLQDHGDWVAYRNIKLRVLP